ncbi:hypothetical protein LPU83_pLPU83d_1470 (plasmid) [Rhizobium favelukesii]|uniref:Uncharacterized protein n=1 Tax=Rhizobium favelukesii TaxID=348824 RepID=W6RRR8_9HYPH|nr:hypothetical protein LPU83_pLPU83d_1470 [Rhizobium favelukesii]
MPSQLLNRYNDAVALTLFVKSRSIRHHLSGLLSGFGEFGGGFYAHDPHDRRIA